MSKVIHYKNGNYQVSLNLQNGTMIRYTKDNFLEPDFPDSMDMKITNFCDRNCPWCHEKSSTHEPHGDIMSDSFIDRLHPYTQLALGGGNVLAHPDFIPFLKKCKTLKLIPSITVNQEHFVSNYSFIKKLANKNLIYGIGVSLVAPTDELVAKVVSMPNAVIHVINGVVSVKDLQELVNKNLKILILGYKTFGRGISFNESNELLIQKNQSDLSNSLKDMIAQHWFKSICFDNLALKQLRVKNLLSPEEWSSFYMGDDGQTTMYVDMVKKEFAATSTSNTRHPLLDDITDMLKIIRREGKVKRFGNKTSNKKKQDCCSV